MKGLILTKNNKQLSYEHERIVEECEKLSIDTSVIYYEALGIHIQNESFQAIVNGNVLDLSEFQWGFCRSPALDQLTKYNDTREIVTQELHRSGVKVLNGTSFLKWPVLSKTLQYYYFSKVGIPFPEVQYMMTFELNEQQFKTPYIMKTINGARGEGVYLIENKKDHQHVLDDNNLVGVLSQKKLNARADYRVLVLNGKLIGAIRRIAAGGSHLTNVSAGGTAEKVEIKAELAEIVLKVAKLFELEFCGVDVMYEDDKPYVLEVNRYAQFRGFEKYTGINVAHLIVTYLSS